MFNRSQEIECQRDALSIISNGDNKIVQELCMYHNMIISISFRLIITDFENRYDRCPTADELIWITSEMLGEDIRKCIN